MFPSLPPDVAARSSARTSARCSADETRRSPCAEKQTHACHMHRLASLTNGTLLPACINVEVCFCFVFVPLWLPADCQRGQTRERLPLHHGQPGERHTRLSDCCLFVPFSHTIHYYFCSVLAAIAVVASISLDGITINSLMNECF